MPETTYRTVLITGGNGLLGMAFQAIQQNYPAYRFIFSTSNVCDLTDHDATLEHVGQLRPGAIIHLAALAGGIGFSMARPATLLRDNVLMNLHVLEAARLHGVRKTIMTLSTGMYPADAPNPIREESIHDGPPHESVYGYAFAKRLVEPSIRAYRAEYRLPVIGLVPNGIFGEHMNFHDDEATMIAALIKRFYAQRDDDGPLVVWGDGSALRENTYSRDMARAYLWCLEHYDDPRILHIGSTEELSVRDIAFAIAELLEIDLGRITFDPSKPSGQPRKHTDNSRFVQRSGFRYTPFREGLRRTVEWFREHAGQLALVRP